MDDEELVDLARGYIAILQLNLADHELERDENTNEFERLMRNRDHLAGLAIGFAKGYRACEAMRATPTLNPGSN